MNFSLPKELQIIARAYDQMNEQATRKNKGQFGFQICPLPIGDKTSGGDAICIRWGYNLQSDSPDQFVMVVDAGEKKDGSSVVNFLREKFNTDRVDLLVNTHSHSDHLGGIEGVLNDLTVGTFMVHCPWNDPVLKPLLMKMNPVTFIQTMPHDNYKVKDVYDLVKKVIKTKVVSPAVGKYAEEKGVTITILGPTHDYYREMFKRIPTACPVTEKDFSDKDFETLTGDEDENAQNATSVVIALTLNDAKGIVVILTADATPEAQRLALKNAKDQKVALEKLRVFQIPHHGSIGNSRKDTLDSFLCSVDRKIRSKCFAFASVPADASGGHPDKNIVAAIKQRGWQYRDRHEKAQLSFTYGLA